MILINEIGSVDYIYTNDTYKRFKMARRSYAILLCTLNVCFVCIQIISLECDIVGGVVLSYEFNGLNSPTNNGFNNTYVYMVQVLTNKKGYHFKI